MVHARHSGIVPGAERKIDEGTTGMELTRKEMLKLSLLGSAVLLLPLERTARTQVSVRDRIPEGRLPRPFRTPFVVPPVARPVRTDATADYYRLTMRRARVQILPAPFGPTTIFGYNGVTPGPTIRARRGRGTVVRQINALPQRHPVLGYRPTTSVHLHGSDSEPQYDGWADDVTQPGEYKDYYYPNDQDARTLWYHDHGVHHTAQNAYMGCAAQYHTSDDLEDSLPIPKGYWNGRPGHYDVPLMIRDAIFATSGELIYDDESESNLMGDVILVNGAPWPVMKVERRKYRFRILNASLSRGYRLALSSGDPMTIIGHDGGLAPAPVEVGSFRTGPAERYEVVIDFARRKVGERVVLRNLGVPNSREFASTQRIMRFDVISDATDTANNSIPSVLNPGEGPYSPMNLQTSEAVRTRRWVFRRKNGLWTINGRTWDPARSDASVGLDDVEVWQFENRGGGWNHPVHVHLIDFRILDRNGKPPFAWERGPKDTAYVGENETVRVIARFGPRRGKYMMHCHNLVHEDHDMMTHFDVGPSGVDPATIDPPRPYDPNNPPPL